MIYGNIPDGAQSAGGDTCRESVADIDEEAIVPFEPYVLIEGVLEKSKTKKDFFLSRPFGKSKEKWVRRYFRLRCKEDPEIFFLEQFADESPKSKVRRTLEMERVSQVFTNIVLKNGNKNWIFSIHFCSRPDRTPKDSVLYLAADSEEAMNKWVAKLCLAGNLRRQGHDDQAELSSSVSPLSVNNAQTSARVSERLRDSEIAESFDSFVETPTSERTFALDENCVVKPGTGYTLLKHCSGGAESQSRISTDRRLNSEEGVAITQPYIHLKNCTTAPPSQVGVVVPSHRRNQSFGSSSASSSQFSFSSDNDSSFVELPVKSPIDSLPPPPRPPKTKSRLRSVSNSERDDGAVDMCSNAFSLNQPLPPPDLDEIGLDDYSWSGETIRPSCDEEKQKDDVAPPASAPNLPDPLVPPKVDRSCKPQRKENYSQPDDIKILPPRRQKSSPPPPTFPKPPTAAKPKFSVPIIPRTNPLNRLQRDNSRPEALSGEDDDTPVARNPPPVGVAEYFDPAENLSDLTLENTSSPATPNADEMSAKTRLVEYALIDEASTQAVLHANMLQNELRAKIHSGNV